MSASLLVLLSVLHVRLLCAVRARLRRIATTIATMVRGIATAHTGT